MTQDCDNCKHLESVKTHHCTSSPVSYRDSPIFSQHLAEQKKEN